MEAYQHSGNACSGLCNDWTNGLHGTKGCPHDDCWQCVERKQGKMQSGDTDDMVAAQRLLRTKEERHEATEGAARLAELEKRKAEMERRAAAADAKVRELEAALKSQPQAQPPNTVTLTRELFEDIVSQLQQGMRVGYEKDGQPYLIHDTQMAPRQVMVSGRKNGKSIVAQVMDEMGKTTAAAFDAAVADILRDANAEEEAKVKDELKATGATDADIEAAEKLLRTAKEGTLVSDPQGIGLVSTVAQNRITGNAIKDMMRRLEAQGAKPSYAVVHPSVILDA